MYIVLSGLLSSIITMIATYRYLKNGTYTKSREKLSDGTIYDTITEYGMLITYSIRVYKYGHIVYTTKPYFTWKEALQEINEYNKKEKQEGNNV